MFIYNKVKIIIIKIRDILNYNGISITIEINNIN